MHGSNVKRTSLQFLAFDDLIEKNVNVSVGGAFDG
jgi:hypothetical protein